MKPDCAEDVWVFLACVLFFLGLYKEAQDAASKGKLDHAHVKHSVSIYSLYLSCQLTVKCEQDMVCA